MVVAFHCCWTQGALLFWTGFPLPWPLFFWGGVCLGLHSWHMEVPSLGGTSELQLWAYATATAMPDPSRTRDLHHSSQQRWVLNPLSEARDWMVASGMLDKFVTAEPWRELPWPHFCKLAVSSSLQYPFWGCCLASMNNSTDTVSQVIFYLVDECIRWEEINTSA